MENTDELTVAVETEDLHAELLAAATAMGGSISIVEDRLVVRPRHGDVEVREVVLHVERWSPRLAFGLLVDGAIAVETAGVGQLRVRYRAPRQAA